MCQEKEKKNPPIHTNRLSVSPHVTQQRKIMKKRSKVDFGKGKVCLKWLQVGLFVRKITAGQWGSLNFEKRTFIPLKQ